MVRFARDCGEGYTRREVRGEHPQMPATEDGAQRAARPACPRRLDGQDRPDGI